MCLCCVAPSQGPIAWLKLQKCWCLLSTACLELVAFVFPTKNGFSVEQKPQGESLSLCHAWETARVSVLAPREEAESGLVFLGLLVMESHLKQEMKPVL